MPALSQSRPTIIFAFVFLLPTPLLDLLGEPHCYICQLPFHTTSQNDATLLLSQWSQQQYMGSRPLLFSTEMLVSGVLPAEIHRVRCLVAICGRVHVPKPKFFSGLITNKPIWLCLIIITKAVQKNMHCLTVCHIESPHWPHRADRSLISSDKCMLREKHPGRRHPKLLDILVQAVCRFKF